MLWLSFTERWPPLQPLGDIRFSLLSMEEPDSPSWTGWLSCGGCGEQKENLWQVELMLQWVDQQISVLGGGSPCGRGWNTRSRSSLLLACCPNTPEQWHWDCCRWELLGQWPCSRQDLESLLLPGEVVGFISFNITRKQYPKAPKMQQPLHFSVNLLI